MATSEVRAPTTEQIRQSIKNRLLDMDDEERARRGERDALERALTDLTPGAPRKPGRKPRQAA